MCLLCAKHYAQCIELLKRPTLLSGLFSLREVCKGQTGQVVLPISPLDNQ